jgi:hypothetical protein
MANFKTYITETGFRKLLETGLLNGVSSFKIGDESILYGIENNNIEPAFFNIPLVGNREGTTANPICLSSSANPIPLSPLTESEILKNNRRVKINFVSEDCSIPFESSNLKVKINIDKWSDQLLSLKTQPYNRSVSGLKINIWDYLIGYIEEYDVINNNWKIIDSENFLDIRYTLKSVDDLEKYKLLNPKYMELKTDGSRVFNNKQSLNRFSSNMLIGFNTKTITGVDVYGSSLTLALYPDRWGYLVDGDFINTGDFEEIVKSNGTGDYKTIYPAIQIDGRTYYQDTNTDYRSVDGVAYFVYGFKDENGVTAIDALTDKIKLFMKANATEVSPDLYQMEINLKTDLIGGVEFNDAYSNKNIGGELTLLFSYNDTGVSSNLYEIL